MKTRHIKRQFLLKILCVIIAMGAGFRGLAVEVTLPNTDSRPLAYQISYLEDKQHKLTPWDILNMDSTRFFKNQKEIIHLSYTPSSYWFKVELKNRTGKNEFVLEIENPQLDSIMLYQFVDGKLIFGKDKKTLLTDENNVPLFRSTLIQPFELKSGQSVTFILKMRSVTALKNQLTVYSPAAFDKVQQKKLFIYTFFTGILCLVFLFSLFLFFVIKDKVYLYYGGYALCFWLTIIGISGYLISVPLIARYDLRQLFTFGLLFFALKFTDTFLLVGKYSPKLSQKIKVALYYVLFCFVLYLLMQMDLISLSQHKNLYVVLPLLYNILLLITCGLIISAILTAITHHYIPGWFYLIGLSPVIIITVLGILGNAKLIPFYQVVDYYYVGGVIFEIMVLYSGLVYRFKTYKDQKEKLLIEYNNSQKELVNSLVMGQEIERKRLAEELHDGLGQWLAITKLHIDNTVIANVNGTLTVGDYIDRSIKELRDISKAMMPGTLVYGGIIPALEEMVATINAAGKIDVELYSDEGFKKRFKSEVEIAIFRIIQEALTNIVKHADAKQASVQLLTDDRGIKLMIEDDGVGFVYHIGLHGNGLKNILSRVQLLKGSIEINSAPQKGTLIFVEIPLPA